MARIGIKLHWELEAEGISEESLRTVEMAMARYVETQEAMLVEHLGQFPGLKITLGGDDEDWKA